MKAVFSDIDGVLLSGRAWVMPCNRDAWEKLYASRRLDLDAARRADGCLRARFGDQVGGQDRGKLAISSNWRHTVGGEFAFEKLVNEGIPSDLMGGSRKSPVLSRRRVP